jgi:hypothetical protein
MVAEIMTKLRKSATQTATCSEDRQFLTSAICNVQSAICNLQSAICNLQSEPLTLMACIARAFLKELLEN